MFTDYPVPNANDNAVERLERVLYPDLTGIYKRFPLITTTHISHNISHKINTPLAQLTTTKEVLNTIRQALSSTQQKTYRIYEGTKNNKELNHQNSLVRNAIFRALSQSDQLTTNNRPLLVICYRSVLT